MHSQSYRTRAPGEERQVTAGNRNPAAVLRRTAFLPIDADPFGRVRTGRRRRSESVGVRHWRGGKDKNRRDPLDRLVKSERAGETPRQKRTKKMRPEREGTKANAGREGVTRTIDARRGYERLTGGRVDGARGRPKALVRARDEQRDGINSRALFIRNLLYTFPNASHYRKSVFLPRPQHK